MSVQDIIKSRRKELGLTLKEVAERLRVSEGTVSRYESGDIQNMGIDKIASLAKVLQCSPGYLMGWEEAPGSPAAVSQDPNEEKLVSAYRSFNALGRERLMDYVGYLESKPENLSPELFPFTKEEGDGLSSGGIA